MMFLKEIEEYKGDGWYSVAAARDERYADLLAGRLKEVFPNTEYRIVDSSV